MTSRVCGIAITGILCSLLYVCTPSLAGVEPSPFQPAINKLNAISNELQTVHDRLSAALALPADAAANAPKSIVGKLTATGLQLLAIDRQIDAVISLLPNDPAALPAGTGSVLSSVQNSAQAIANLAEKGLAVHADDGLINDALEAVHDAALAVATSVPSYLNTGYQEVQTLQVVSIYPQLACNSEEPTMCSSLSDAQFHSVLDGTNSLFYRSNSIIRVRSAVAVIPPAVNITPVNSNCKLLAGFFPWQITINGQLVEVLATQFYNIDAGQMDIRTFNTGDVNSDGVVDKADAAVLCDPYIGEEQQPFFQVLGKYTIQDGSHAAAVFIRNGTDSIEWDDVNSVWRHYHIPGGGSSCQGFGITLPNNMSDAEGNGFSHELGHYLCNPHTFHGSDSAYDPESSLPVAEQLRNTLIAARNSILCDGTDPNCPDPRTVVKKAFDHDDEYMVAVDPADWIHVENAAALELNILPVTDTPGDPGKDAWKAYFGSAHVCDRTNSKIPIMIDNVEHDIQPDRTSIMSYFSSCFKQEAHFTSIQRQRAERSVTDLHRVPVTTPHAITTWRNDTLVQIEDASLAHHFIAPATVPLKWAVSRISVHNSPAGTGGRVIIGVSIYQMPDEGDLHMEIVDPQGGAHQLPDQTSSRLGSFIKSLYYVTASSMDGLWTLRVAEQPAFDPVLVSDPFGRHHRGAILGWQLQFEEP